MFNKKGIIKNNISFKSNFLKNKKTIVSLNVFVLLILLYLGIFLSSYYLYYNYKLSSESSFKQKECFNSAVSFRSQAIQVLRYPNSTLLYKNFYNSDSLIITIKTDTITAKKAIRTQDTSINISTLGMVFCSNYNFSEINNVNMNYNGSCINLIIT